MVTQAIAAYGTQLMLGNDIPPAAVAVSGTTNASPIVLTTAAHGIPVGGVMWVTVATVGGNLGANGSWIAEGLTATTVKLRGSVGTGAYTSGGTMQATGTYTRIAEVRDITPIGMQFRMVDVSSHDGDGWGSSIPTEKMGPNMRVDINLVPDHATHDEVTGLIYLALNRIRRHWMIIFPDAGKTTFAWVGWVSDHGTNTPVADALRASPVISVDGAMIFSFT
jgi:hypothetical protein